jgi:hypothetical protein
MRTQEPRFCFFFLKKEKTKQLIFILSKVLNKWIIIYMMIAKAGKWYGTAHRYK